MNEHIVVKFGTSGAIVRMYGVSFDGTKQELAQLIEDNRSWCEIFDPNTEKWIDNKDYDKGMVQTTDILDALGIKYREIWYVADAMYEGVTIERTEVGE